MDRYTVTTPPTELPVTLSAVKALLRITHDAEDALLTSLISVATDALEAYTNRCFVTRTIRGEFDAVLCSGHEVYPFIKLRRSPVGDISSVQASSDGVFADVTYQLKQQSGYSRILFPSSFSTDDTPFPLRADFIAGYGDADDVPEGIKTAILQYINFLYSNRGDCAPECGLGLPIVVRALIGPYKIIDTFSA